MLKRSLAFVVGFCLLFTLVGCNTPDEIEVSGGSESEAVSSAEPENPYAKNPLTGLYDMDKFKTALRPVGIMIDNDSTAQRDTQSGLSRADIVYETETEGGITRLMGMFADIGKADQLGDVRSARYVYVDLAMGHNAIYVHSGKEPVYCAAHLKDLDNFEITYNYYGKRIHYGSAKGWQELFTTGETLIKGFADKNWKTTADSDIPLWQSFAEEGESVTLAGGVANKATVKFSSAATSYFTYDGATGKYIKTSKATENKDRNNGEAYAFKNVVVLSTDMGWYPVTTDAKRRRNISLEGGSGYYMVNGTYQSIKWKKGNSTDPLVFMNEDGTPLKMNSGNTWVCIVNKEFAPSFE